MLDRGGTPEVATGRMSVSGRIADRRGSRIASVKVPRPSSSVVKPELCTAEGAGLTRGVLK
eukprot:778484-Prymnesium_polylepis.1